MPEDDPPRTDSTDEADAARAARAGAGGCAGGGQPSSAAIPERELGDPRTLRALAHPLRMQILDQLLIHGPLTATELGERLGESPANSSWHLRQLAKHGFIEEAEGGSGRQRPWRMVPQSASVSDRGSPEPEFDAARDALIEVLLGQDLAAWKAWRADRHTEPEPWRDAGFMTQSNYIWMTADELAALRQEMTEVGERHIMPRLSRLDPAERPPGSRPIRFIAWAVPSGPPHEQTGAATHVDHTHVDHTSTDHTDTDHTDTDHTGFYQAVVDDIMAQLRERDHADADHTDTGAGAGSD